MNFFQRIRLLVLFVIIFGSPIVLMAQTKPPVKPVDVYLEITSDKATIGDNVKVRILIDSDIPVNVIDLSISYPSQYISVPIFNDANSIIQIWQTRDWKNTKGSILLAGGLPRPFAGTKGEIGILTFKAIKEGIDNISINSANIFYADGKGTKAKVSIGGAVIRVNKPTSSVIASTTTETIVENNQSDEQPPVFSLTDTLKNSTNGKRIAIFQVTDIGSGIDEVTLRSMKWFGWSEWSIVSNPTELPDGIWKYQLSAKDNAGNISVVSAYIWSKILTLLAIVILIPVFLIIVRYFIIKR